MRSLLFLSLVDFKTVRPPEASGGLTGGLLDFRAPTFGIDAGIVVAFCIGLAVVGGLLLWKAFHRTPAPPAPTGPWILVDGSNVMHWQDNAPKLAPLSAVVERLKVLGYAPGVVFDANAGWKLFGRYVPGDEFAHLLLLPREQVFVVPKGEPADPYLLDVARDHNARIVTNDRFRDWAEAHPEVLQPGLLVRGGWQDGTVALQGLEVAAVESPPTGLP